MGGHAFGFESNRFGLDILEKHISKLDEIFSENFPTVRWDLVPFYRTKTDFGDLDILVEKNGTVDRQLIDDKLIEVFHDTTYKVVRNGIITSILSKTDGIQLDFIHTKSSMYNASIAFYSWNDMGNFLGKIANKCGLKLGFDGLSVNAHDGVIDVGNIHLTSDPIEYFTFFGWDYERFASGFDTLDDIYDYVSNQPYFSGVKYKIDELDLSGRRKQKKRSTFQGFVEYLTKNNKIDLDFEIDRSEFRIKALTHFGKLDEWNHIWRKYEESKIIKTKFNGSIVGEITGISGVELGKFISLFKKEAGDNFNYMILTTPQDIIVDMIKNFKWN